MTCTRLASVDSLKLTYYNLYNAGLYYFRCAKQHFWRLYYDSV